MSLLKPLTIGSVHIDTPLLLAPMAGITNQPFRELCRQYGCVLAYTEMVSAKGMHYGGENTFSLLRRTGEQGPLGVQIFGSDPELMARQVATQAVQEFDIIDINMGCPAGKIVRNGDGSALMKDIHLAERIITACVKASKKPVTVKFRLGWDEERIIAEEFARMAAGAGARAITLHARTTAQGYSGRADWSYIARVKKVVDIPVIGNGDIFSGEDALNMIKQTACDGVMVARGARGNPWIFEEIRHLDAGEEPRKVDMQERIRVMLAHIDRMRECYPQRVAVLQMRKHIQWYMKGLNRAAFLREQVYRAESIEELKAMVADLDREG